jgi:hypothetical protein
MRRAVQQASDHLSERGGRPVESTERDARGRSDRRVSLELTDASDDLSEGRDPLDKRGVT